MYLRYVMLEADGLWSTSCTRICNLLNPKGYMHPGEPAKLSKNKHQNYRTLDLNWDPNSRPRG